MPRARISKSSGIWPVGFRTRFSTVRLPRWCSATATRSPTTSSSSASPATTWTSPTASPTGSRRPLSSAQLAYAVSDVTHLRDVYLALADDLARAGRSEWVGEEMEVLTSPGTYRAEPENAWQRLKTRVRKPKELAVLIEIAAWREREAQARDLPRGRVLRDEVLGDIAMQAPTSLDRLSHVRSLPKGFERSRWGADVIETVQRGLARDLKSLPPIDRQKPTSANGATVELMKVLLRMTSEQHGVAAKVIATVDELEQIAADDTADVAALKGWRRELFGRRRWHSSKGGWRCPSSAAAWLPASVADGHGAKPNSNSKIAIFSGTPHRDHGRTAGRRRLLPDGDQCDERHLAP